MQGKNPHSTQGIKKRLIISAYNIHQGGGKTLLKHLLSELPSDQETVCFIDQRFKITEDLTANSKINIITVSPTFLSRLKAECQLCRLAESSDTLLSLGNLPPLFFSQAKTFIYVQNKYLIGKKFINSATFTSFIRSFIERFWFATRKQKKYIYLVQTPSMKRLLQSYLPYGYQVIIAPFLKNQPPITNHIDKSSIPIKHFLYVASGEPHKNHINLLKTWLSLASDHIQPKLTLVVDYQKFNKLKEWLNENYMKHKLKDRLNIEFIAHLDPLELSKLYSKVDCLIYPSLYESFGLPLIEAKAHKLAVIASELDYVRDLLDPEETFDPNSPLSIARSVRRYLKCPSPKLSIMSPKDFIHYISQY